MTDDQMNGAPPAPEQQSAMLQQITPPIRNAMQAVMRGLQTGFPGVPEHVLLQLMCFEAAFYCGQALGGDVVTLIKLRHSFKTAFDDGIKKAPMNTPKDWQPSAGEIPIGGALSAVSCLGA